jgi:uncharacterized protein (DUF1810 family)
MAYTTDCLGSSSDFEAATTPDIVHKNSKNQPLLLLLGAVVHRNLGTILTVTVAGALTFFLQYRHFFEPMFRSMGTTTGMLMVVVLCISTGLLLLLVLVVILAYHTTVTGRRLVPQPIRRLGAALRALLIREEDQEGANVGYVELPHHETSSSCQQRNVAPPVRPAAPLQEEQSHGGSQAIHHADPVLKPNLALGQSSGTESTLGSNAMRIPPNILPTGEDFTLHHETNTVTPETSARLSSHPVASARNQAFNKNVSAYGSQTSPLQQSSTTADSDHVLSRNHTNPLNQSTAMQSHGRLGTDFQTVGPSSIHPGPSSGSNEGNNALGKTATMAGKRFRPQVGKPSLKIPRKLSPSTSINRSTDEDESTRNAGRDALAAILDAQNGGHPYYPPYEHALAEIRRGAKRSCWMWYIWPSMEGIRSHRMPHMILPSLHWAVEYLNHEILRERLIEITTAAHDVLSSGRSTTIRLFDGELDSTKVHEACTFFALAAVAANNRHADDATVFIQLVQHHFGGLNDTVMTHFHNDGKTDQRLLILAAEIASRV